MLNGKAPYTEDDVYEILEKSRLPLKTSLKDLPLKRISQELSHYLMLYCAYQATFEEDTSPKPKINQTWLASYLTSQRREVDEIIKNLKKLQNYSSKLRTSWLKIKDSLPKFRYFLRDYYDDYTPLVLHKMLSEILENKTISIEGWAIDTLKRIKKTHWEKRQEVGRPPKTALIQFTQNVARCFQESLDKKPGKDWKGPFGRFLYYCLEHVGIDEYGSPDEHSQLEPDDFECPGNFEPWDWEECQRHQLEKHFPSACPVCPRRNWKPPLKADKPKPTLEKIIKTALKNR